MKLFARLYYELDATTRTSEKVAALVRYFREAEPRDSAWAVFVLSGRKIGRGVSSRLLREWAAEACGYPAWLVDQCYRVVGDLSETLSLLVPSSADGGAAPPLHELIEQCVRPLARLTRQSQRQIIEGVWARLNADQRLVFHKLLSGNFRVGVSKTLMMRALAQTAGVEPGLIAHRLAGHWNADEASMKRLLSAHDSALEPMTPYPFMLAHPLADGLPSLGSIDEWLIEWKWDGIRAQVIRRGGQTAVWSRGDEAVAAAFPEIVQAAGGLADGTVLDGEIVAWDSAADRPEPFTRLQRRLNRRSVEMTFWPEVTVTFIAFDLLEHQGCDLRETLLDRRRELLGSGIDWPRVSPGLRLREPVTAGAWEQIGELVAGARQKSVEGVVLKRRVSPYLAGRPTGLWWKLKVQPLTMDAVLIAAEPGHGRRAGLLTDYTFGVWDEQGTLVPIAKAYSGLSDPEIAEMDRFARRHTMARHGPVHLVEPLRVFEIGFEAIGESPRHKSGLAVRFPRILRMRGDKTAADADSLANMRRLLAQLEASR